MLLRGRIVFAAGRPGTFHIWLLNLRDSQLTQLTRGDCSCESPRWSPDGKKIVYVSTVSGAAELWLMNADGSEQEQLTAAGRHHTAPTWHPDGSLIVCSANYPYGGSDDSGFWAVSADGTGQPQFIVRTTGLASSVELSPDGGSLLVSRSRRGCYNIAEYEITNGVWHWRTPEGADDFAPACSPDGNMIAFVSSRDPDNPRGTTDYGIWLMNRDGTARRRVSHGEGQDKYVSWSPRGRHLVYCASDPGSASERLKAVDLIHDHSSTIKFSRQQIKEALESKQNEGHPPEEGLISYLGITSEALTEMLYVDSFFGTERDPDWKD